MSDTTFYNLDDVVKGYLALQYGCGIESFTKDKDGFVTYSADGFIILRVQLGIGPGIQAYYINNFCGQHLDIIPYKNALRISYKLDDIKKLFIAKLSGAEVKFKKR